MSRLFSLILCQALSWTPLSQQSRSFITKQDHPFLLFFWSWLFSHLRSTGFYLWTAFRRARWFLVSLGAPGIFIIAIFDSSLLSIPEINDLLIVSACARHWEAVFYYPLMAASGSVIGCLILFHVARRGGRALLHRRFSEKNV